MTGDAPSALVVDDNADIRLLVRLQLQAHGWSVREAATGREALESCQDDPPDIVLLDVGLPGLDGWAVLRRMKADPFLEHVPVVILTGRDSSQDIAHGLGGGAHDHLAKPFDADELWARTASALRLCRDREELRRLDDELDRSDRTDLATGLPDRRQGEEQLALLSGAGRAGGCALAVVVFGIDDFEGLKHTWGREAGDRVLHEVGRRVRSVLRAEDFVARWWDDDLVALLPETGLEGARAAAERARVRVSATRIDAGAGRRLPVSVSAGCGTGWEAVDAALAAEHALEEARRAGRDTVRW